MAVVDFDDLKDRAEVIINETEPGANDEERVGSLFFDNTDTFCAWLGISPNERRNESFYFAAMSAAIGIEGDGGYVRFNGSNNRLEINGNTRILMQVNNSDRIILGYSPAGYSQIQLLAAETLSEDLIVYGNLKVSDVASFNKTVYFNEIVYFGNSQIYHSNRNLSIYTDYINFFGFGSSASNWILDVYYDGTMNLNGALNIYSNTYISTTSFVIESDVLFGNNNKLTVGGNAYFKGILQSYSVFIFGEENRSEFLKIDTSGSLPRITSSVNMKSIFKDWLNS
jgi:hypothetical protein